MPEPLPDTRRPPAAMGELMDRLQAELRQIADRELRNERVDHTLQPTALVNEAYLRLIGQRNLGGADRDRFLGAAAVTMRRILVDHARQKRAAFRGGQAVRVTLAESDAATPGPDLDLLALDEALDALERLNGRMAAVVEMRYFGGLSVDATADALHVSPRTVAEDWAFARAWLQRAMSAGPRT